MSASRAELRLVRDADTRELAGLIAELTKASTRMQPHLDQEKRSDWIDILQDDLDGEPLSLAIEGVIAAGRTCKFASEFLPTVLDYVEPRKRKLTEAVARYEAIVRAIRGGDGEG